MKEKQTRCYYHVKCDNAGMVPFDHREGCVLDLYHYRGMT